MRRHKNRRWRRVAGVVAVGALPLLLDARTASAGHDDGHYDATKRFTFTAGRYPNHTCEIHISLVIFDFDNGADAQARTRVTGVNGSLDPICSDSYTQASATYRDASGEDRVVSAYSNSTEATVGWHASGMTRIRSSHVAAFENACACATPEYHLPK